MDLRSRAQKVNQDPDDVRMTLGEHLEELRTRLIRILAAALIAAVICYLFVDHIIAMLNWPVYVVLENIGVGPQMIITNLPEAFLMDLKISAISGLILSAPYALYQMWGFVAAGLYSRERLWVRRFAPTSVGLFYAGVIFLLVVVNPILTNFLLTYRTEYPNYSKHMNWILPDKEVIPAEDRQKAVQEALELEKATTQPAVQPFSIPAYEEDPQNPARNAIWINLNEGDLRLSFQNKVYKIEDLKVIKEGNPLVPRPRISEHIAFILHLALAFGVGFQVPVVVAFLASLNIASTEEMAKYRRHVWLGMAMGAAFLTPPDLGSMGLLLLPMAALFEVGLIAGRFLEKERAQET
jgi:Sec-independent protein secretion pathway component TatC